MLYAIGSVLIYFIVKESVERQSVELLRQKIRDFAEDTRIMPTRDGQGVGTINHDFFDLDFAQLYDDSGKSLRISRALDGKSLPFQKESERGIKIDYISLPDGRPGRVGFLSFHPKVHRRGPPEFRGPPQMDNMGNPVSPPPVSSRARRGFNDDFREHHPNQLHLSVAIPIDDERLTMRILALTLLLTGLLLAAAIFYVVRYQVEKSLHPVDQLVDLTNTINPNQLSLRLPSEDLPVELRPLIGQFNTLLDRLESAFTREKSFSANIGHEIRTPLTELSALLENAVQDSQQEKPEESPEEVYRDADEICRHMSRLVEVISSIHQAESGRELVSVSDTDPEELVEDIVSMFDRDFDIRIRSSKKIETDESLLRAIIQNLISNAAVHSKPDSKIICEIFDESAGGVKIEISNAPKDLTAEDLDRITEPFWQKDSSHTERGNLGLGLSLVEKYAELINAKTNFSIRGDRFVAQLIIPNLTA